MIRLMLLLALLTAPSQAAELKIATWNLEWLTLRTQGDPALPENVEPKRPADLDGLRRYALLLDADVVALQEVDGPEVAARVFPPDRYALYLTRDDVIQRVGFAVRHGIAVERNPDLVGLDIYPRRPAPSSQRRGHHFDAARRRAPAAERPPENRLPQRPPLEHKAGVRDAAHAGAGAAGLDRATPGGVHALRAAGGPQPPHGWPGRDVDRAQRHGPPAACDGGAWHPVLGRQQLQSTTSSPAALPAPGCSPIR